MICAGRKGLGAVLAAAALSAVGCCEKLQQENQELKEACNQLTNQKQSLAATVDGLQSQLAEAETAKADLQRELEGGKRDLAQREADIQELRKALDELERQPRPRPEPPEGQVGTGWQRTAAGDRITVGTDVLFPVGRATLTSGGKAALDKIVRDLKTIYADLPVRVYGYTDSDPIRKTKHLWKDNLDLSANRAMAVTRYLTDGGIGSERVETIAMGQTHPVASNSTAAGKQKNRRVEIVVIRQPS